MCPDEHDEDRTMSRVKDTRLQIKNTWANVSWTDNDPILTWKDPNLKKRARDALAEENKKKERHMWRQKQGAKHHGRK